MRDVPHAGIYFSFYEYFKQQFRPFIATDLSNRIVSGVVAGVFSTILTQPFDFIKTKVQLDPTKYPNMFVAIKTVLREDGLRGLFIGGGIRLMRKTLSSAVTWTIYEELTNKRL